MATFSFPIVPFPVPDTVTLQRPAGKRQDGMQPAIELSLEQLDDETLTALIEEFANSVMAKARPT